MILDLNEVIIQSTARLQLENENDEVTGTFDSYYADAIHLYISALEKISRTLSSDESKIKGTEILQEIWDSSHKSLKGVKETSSLLMHNKYF